MKLPKQSQERLEEVHPDLQRVVYRCAELGEVEFVVMEGLRTLERQKQLVAKGASKTLRSRHLPDADGVACAVDLAVTIEGEIRWDWPLYYDLADAMKEAAQAEGVQIEWGGDWKSFKDGPHFQLPWAVYP